MVFSPFRFARVLGYASDCLRVFFDNLVAVKPSFPNAIKGAFDAIRGRNLQRQRCNFARNVQRRL
jgi:hypothetical protein